MKKIYIFILLMLPFSVFSQISQPNVLILLVDDGSYASYLPTGGPSYFTSPSINRIANEGANFKNFFVTLSVCNPSRATLLTGLMANHHHLLGNGDSLAYTTATIGSILKTHGYFTSFLGKYPDISNSQPRPGWNYWMAFQAGTGLHENANYNINGTSKEIPGFNDYTLADTAISIIKRNAHNKPFLIVLAYSGVHEPYLAPPGMDGIFDSVGVTVPPNFFPYTENYPNQIYDGSEYPNADSCIHDIRNYYEMLNGIDTTVKRFFSVLDSLNETDSTMIVYTSDNGFLRGEHLLHGKTKAYEPSMRVPLFIRYPQWFAPNSVVIDPLTLNIDIAPTVLDAAGITDIYNMDGHSLQEYATGNLDRDEFYFQSSSGGILRAVRSKTYKYIYYNCTSQTEEFFNLVTDPDEDTNRINASSYQALIAEYRYKMDSLKDFWGDTIVPIRQTDCFLANPIYDGLLSLDNDNSFNMSVNPNPASDQVEIIWRSNALTSDHLFIYSSMGKLKYETVSVSSSPQHALDLPVAMLPNGLYEVRIVSGSKVLTHTFEVLK